MKPELAALARHRMAQAHETLAEADQLLASQAFRGAVNRLYYATFYAARARREAPSTVLLALHVAPYAPVV